MNYPKIQTIFKRTETGEILPDQITKREFEVIDDWTITEKIDGTNIHVDFEKTDDLDYNWKVTYHGKTDNAQIPIPLMNHLIEMFGEQLTKYVNYFTSNDESVSKIIIFGEGYGAGIQNGGSYSKDQRFIAYDMWIDGWWLEPLHAKRICEEIDVPFVPVVALNTRQRAIEFIQSKPMSMLAPEHIMEGLVASSNPLMLFRDGTPIKWKLKQKDYGFVAKFGKAR
jgi:hypothetical protein